MFIDSNPGFSSENIAKAYTIVEILQGAELNLDFLVEQDKNQNNILNILAELGLHELLVEISHNGHYMITHTYASSVLYQAIIKNNEEACERLRAMSKGILTHHNENNAETSKGMSI